MSQEFEARNCYKFDVVTGVDISELWTWLTALITEVKRLREAVKKYGRHNKGCPMAGYPDDVLQPIPGVIENCTCGFDRAKTQEPT